jgi:hypothetical protein
MCQKRLSALDVLCGCFEGRGAGKLPYVKDGRRVLIGIKDMDDFIERNKMQFTY